MAPHDRLKDIAGSFAGKLLHDADIQRALAAVASRTAFYDGLPALGLCELLLGHKICLTKYEENQAAILLARRAKVEGRSSYAQAGPCMSAAGAGERQRATRRPNRRLLTSLQNHLPRKSGVANSDC